MRHLIPHSVNFPVLLLAGQIRVRGTRIRRHPIFLGRLWGHVCNRWCEDQWAWSRANFFCWAVYGWSRSSNSVRVWIPGLRWLFWL